MESKEPQLQEAFLASGIQLLDPEELRYPTLQG